MSKNIKLSVVIITFNEEKNIKASLDSVVSVADEIIVVDSFSTDKTAEICQNTPKVRFLQNAFLGYGQQKQFATQQAKYDYILSLDADERLSKDLIIKVLELKKKWTAAAYYVRRLNRFCGKWIRHGNWYPDYQMRLFDRRLAGWNDAILHENVYIYGNEKPTFLKAHILHETIDSISQHLAQINKFTSLSAEKMFAKQEKATFYTLYLKPIFKFIESFVLKLGFLDGFYGFVVSKNSAFSVYLKYAKLRELYQKEK
ncbi:MAG: glycosyltransferase family 2 protein [Chitinophagales bacterium]